MLQSNFIEVYLCLLMVDQIVFMVQDVLTLGLLIFIKGVWFYNLLMSFVIVFFFHFLLLILNLSLLISQHFSLARTSICISFGEQVLLIMISLILLLIWGVSVFLIRILLLNGQPILIVLLKQVLILFPTSLWRHTLFEVFLVIYLSVVIVIDLLLIILEYWGVFKLIIVSGVDLVQVLVIQD